MTIHEKIAVVFILALAASGASAQGQTVTLELPTMNCAVCPITVKKALHNVTGVTDVRVSFEKKEAVVTFDDARTSSDELVKATTNAGYPSTVKRDP